MSNPTYFSEIELESPDLFYKFEEASGTLADSSSNSVDLDVFTVAPTYGVASIIPSQSETCITLVQASNTEFASTSNNPAALSGDVAWTACWWNDGFRGTTADHPFIEFSDYRIWTPNLGSDYLQAYHVAGADIGASLSWVHTSAGYTTPVGGAFYAIVHDQPNNRYILYMNGKAIVTSSAYSAGKTPSTNDSPTTIGGTTCFQGSIQGLAVMAGVKTAARILELFYAGVAGQTSAPIP